MTHSIFSQSNALYNEKVPAKTTYFWLAIESYDLNQNAIF